MDVSSAPKRDEWLRWLALHILNILESIPLESHTRCIQPFIMVTTSSELRKPTAEEELGRMSLEIAQARKFVRSRMEAFRFILPPHPAQRKLDLVLAVWSELDTNQTDVYWMDVMIEKEWEVVFG